MTLFNAKTQRRLPAYLPVRRTQTGDAQAGKGHKGFLRRIAWVVLASIPVDVTTAAETAATEPNPQWPLCALPFVPPAISDLTVRGRGEAAGPTIMHADFIEATREQQFTLRGNVTIDGGGARISAERAHYQSKAERVKVPGKVRFTTENLIFLGEDAEFAIGDASGSINQGRYWITGTHARGSADRIEWIQRDRIKFNGVTYTRCNEGDEAWILRASELRLDRSKNEAVAKHARIAFQGVTLFYWPYLSFPIEGRKSGFLAPSQGTSDKTGVHMGIPYYWNIAPNLDATIEPHYYSDRGMQLQTEFRYLFGNRQGRHTQSGSVYVEYLPDDNKTGDDLAMASFQHRGQPARGWQTAVDYRYATDRDYLNDFGNGINTSSLTHLERRLDVNYRGNRWMFNGLFQGFQTLDEVQGFQTLDEANTEPYQRLPQLRLNSDTLTGWLGTQYKVESEWVRFDRDQGVVGSRFDVQPSIAWPLEDAAGFLVPKISLRHTRYRLSGQAEGSDASPSRTLPIYSLDSGLYFDRAMTWGQQTLTQTLEPRLYYVYIPFREQSQLIVFDSSQPLLSLDQMFRENRFSGADRVGDANHLAFALSSRLYNSSGRELVQGSVAQIYYFSDRRVTLPGDSTGQEDQSELLAEINLHWTRRLNSRLSLLWDPHKEQTSRGSAVIRYHPDRDKMLALTHRYEEDRIEQAGMSILWPLHRQWKIAANWQYSLLDDLPLERTVGFEYDSCCWSFRIVHRQYLGSDRQQIQSLWLQLELKGLMSVGEKAEALFNADY